MNMHMGQNVLAETELRVLAAIPNQIVSPANNSPIIGIFQDSLLGSYRFTRQEMVMDPRDAMNLLMSFNRVDPSTLFQNDKKRVTNFDILSQIMPPMTLKYKTDLWDSDNGEDPAISNNILEIRNGQYFRGQLEKKSLGGGTRGILHRICNDYGNRVASDFIDDLQNIITEYMKRSSYSVGVSDLMSNKETTQRIGDIISRKKTEVGELIQKVHTGIFENNTSRSNQVEFELQVNNILNDATKDCDKVSRSSLNPNNRFLMIVNSGSKGSLINISHMISCLGQVNVDAKRVSYGFDSRSLPHFSKFDDSPGARGFIENSYINGLTAHELFFHAMGGRIGLIDTAVKTSQTGYIQRRLIKGLEDLKVEYDMTVRNNKGKIIQYAYGDDCFDPMKTESQVFSLVTMSTEDIYMHYDFLGLSGQDSASSTSIAQIYTKSAQSEFRKHSEETKRACAKWIDEMVSLRDELVRNVFSNTDNNKVVFPVAFQHIINNVQGNLGLLSTSLVDFTPLDAFGLLDEYMAKLRAMHHVPLSRLFYAMYYFYLCPRDLLQVRRFHRQGFILLLETVIMKYKQAIIHPGEMVGVVSGQSIGEPTTQMTLNSFVYETEILVRDKMGRITCVQIGDFAKDGILTSPKKEYYEKKDTTYAELLDYYEVPSCTEDGKTVWKRIEAVTKHPVINEDGTNTMIKVTTKGNREIIATKAKSFLQLIHGKIQAINGSELIVGDYLPVSKITHGISVFHGFLQENQIPALPSCTHVPNKINGIVVSEDRATRYEDIEFDPIVSIVEVPNTTSHAYDLTVEDTRNFDCMHGMCVNDTFHNSGVASKSNVTRGVPRLEEILRLTKNPKNPSLTVHLKPMDEANVEKAKQFATMMEHTTLKDLVKTVQITFDPNDQATLIAEDRELLRKYYAFATMFQECNGTNDTDIVLSTETKSKWIIRMEMNTPTMLDKNITMDDVHYAIQMSKYGASKDLHCIYSDYNEDKLVFRLRVDSILTAKDKKRKSMGATDSADQSDEIYFLKKFQDEMLEQIVLRGIPGIKNVIPRKLMNRVEKMDGKYGNKDTWVLDTTGTNLMDSLALDFIDTTRTYSNDIREMFDVLGIEAARQSIYNEMSEVIEFSGAYVNYHPLSLLCDRMTCNGNMVAIFRTGLFSDNIGPVAKATFEVNTEVLLDASRYGELDNMRGVSANVMCGQPGYYGTNMFQLVLDMDKLTENTSRTNNIPSSGTYGNDDDVDGGMNMMDQDEVDVEKALYGPTKEMQLQRQNQQNIIVQQTMPFETRDSHNMDFCVGDDDNYDVGF